MMMMYLLIYRVTMLIMIDMTEADNVIHKFMMAKAQSLEQQIKQKGELLDIFMKLNSDTDNVVIDQIAMLTTDLDYLIKELLELRKDSEFIAPEVQGVIDRMGDIKSITHERLIESLKGKYLY